MQFELPQEKHEMLFQAYVNEANQYGENYINGDGGCSRYSDFKKWLDFDKNLREEKDLPEGYVGTTTYFVVEDNQIVGTLNIRHYLNDDLLKRGGHIGYSVSVKKRRQGIATAILKFAIRKCYQMGIKKILVTCSKDNTGSKKTIEKCGGLLENEIKINNEKILRYWIGERK